MRERGLDLSRQRRGRRASDPPRRAPAVAGDRRLDLASGAVAAAAPARDVGQVGAEAARRRRRRRSSRAATSCSTRSTTRARASRCSTAISRLTAWNREFADLFDLPPSMLRLGVGLDEIVRFNAARGAYGPGRVRRLRRRALESLLNDDEPIAPAPLSLPSGDRRSARRGCPTAASSRPTPTSRRPCWPRRSSPRPTSGWSGACSERTAELERLNRRAGAAPRPRRRRPISPRRASSPPRATTSSSRSTRRGSTRVR